MAVNDDSILDSVKKVLGIGPDDDSFDVDIILFINSTFATLNQLGVGPADAFTIEDKEPKWSAFIGSATNIASVKQYVAMSVKLAFDPPGTSFAIESTKTIKDELGWRLSVASE